MCELREARLDEEDAAMEVGRALDALKKDRESLAKKERVMDQGLKVSHTTKDNYSNNNNNVNKNNNHVVIIVKITMLLYYVIIQ